MIHDWIQYWCVYVFGTWSMTEFSIYVGLVRDPWVKSVLMFVSFCYMIRDWIQYWFLCCWYMVYVCVVHLQCSMGRGVKTTWWMTVKVIPATTVHSVKTVLGPLSVCALATLSTRLEGKRYSVFFLFMLLVFMFLLFMPTMCWGCILVLMFCLYLCLFVCYKIFQEQGPISQFPFVGV
jgi:hypothetical protein